MITCRNHKGSSEICVYIGATVGGYKLFACPKCGLVYAEESVLRRKTD